MDKLTRKFGDRYDGYRIRNVDPFFLLIPFIMRSRVDSQVYYTDKIEITQLEKFIREKGKGEIEGLKMYHVVCAAMLRLLVERPQLNRFIIWNKLYARNSLSISMSVKKSMNEDAETTVIKPFFEPTDTLSDVVRKFNEEVYKNKGMEVENEADFVAKLIGNMPSLIVRYVVWFLRSLDNIGLLPKAIHKVSPFHTSAFLTNLGSIGINPVYHHIYNFGSTSVFIAMGRKMTEIEIDEEGKPIKRKYIEIKVVADERICDGYYYALSMRALIKILNNPESLLIAPEEIPIDDGVVMKGRKLKTS